ncbi:MAG: FCD domain-containing protein [Nitriliruptorales bacterium]|nr:FCD domain-containing protein [Nitriliruptorales bacterium]
MVVRRLETGRDRLVDAAREEIRAAILSGRLQPGTPLSVPALAGQLGISRTPVRDALMRLLSEGLVQEVRRKGIVVAAFDRRELYELNDVRAALEPLAARHAATMLDEQSLAQLHELLEAHGRAATSDDLERYIDADLSFHGFIGQVSGNRRLAQLLGLLQTQTRLAMRAAASVSGRMPIAHQEHVAIFTALAKGDADAAATAMHDHIINARDVVAGPPEGDQPR